MIDCQLIIEQTGIRYELDLFDSEPLPLIKSINDITNLADRLSDYTKTIRLPGTNNNNDIFSNIFNISRNVVNDTSVNFDPDFNPSLKANCTLYKRGIPQITGYLQLTNIEVVDEYNVEYEVIIIGRQANLFSDIAELKLSQLDLSEYNHEWTTTNIAASWVAPIGEGYYYGLIDYGYGNGVDYYVDYLPPQIYAKTIVDKIFEGAGFRYESDFFNSDLFKKFVVPYSGKALRLDSGSVANRLFSANRTTDSTSALMGGNYARLPFNNKTKDTVPPIGYDATAFEFIVRDRGKNNFITTGEITFTSAAPVTQLYTANLVFRRNGVVMNSVQILNDSLAASASITKTFTLQTGFVSVNAGDVITCELQSFAGSYLDLEFSLLADSILYNQHSGEIAEGDTIPLASLLPNDINQTDFLASIFRTFNLYIDVDKLDNKKLIIEPRDEFYNTTLVDFTEQVDVSKGVKIMPMGALEYKAYKYTFTADTDSLNNKYTSKYTEVYGIADVRIQNDFEKDEYKQDVIFAPRPLSSVSDMVITRIIFKDANGLRVDSPSKISLLMVDPDVAVPTTRWTLKSRSGSSTDYTLVPYVGHLDNVADPNYDLNFAMPREVYYTASKYTNNNLFNIYHRKGIEEITNPNSKIVEYHIKISEIGVQKLSFRDTYLIDKQYYRLYEVDADLNSEDTVKMKFLKLATAPEFVGEQGDINGGNGEIENQDQPIYSKQMIRNDNVNPDFIDATVTGKNNNLEGNGILVNSNDNSVNAENVSVLGGSGNQVQNDGVTLIGTNDYVSNRDGQTVVNGFDMPQTYTFEIDSTIVGDLHSTDYEIMPAVEGYWTEVYEMYATLLFKGLTPTTYNSHPVRVKYQGDDDVDYLASCDNGFIAESEANTVRGRIVLEKSLKSDALVLFSAGNLGSEGNGYLQIQISYRLHQILK
jgi:hypothetical protein